MNYYHFTVVVVLLIIRFNDWPSTNFVACWLPRDWTCPGKPIYNTTIVRKTRTSKSYSILFLVDEY